MAVIRWTLEDVLQAGPAPYTMTFVWNPSQGGSPSFEKQYNTQMSLGPLRGAIIQEGNPTVPTIEFSGTILDQTHYELLETWVDKRVLLELTDDLGRKFRGAIASWRPQREHRPFHPWYHNYTASFIVHGYKTASGNSRFVRFVDA